MVYNSGNAEFCFCLKQEILHNELLTHSTFFYLNHSDNLPKRTCEIGSALVKLLEKNNHVVNSLDIELSKDGGFGGDTELLVIKTTRKMSMINYITYV